MFEATYMKYEVNSDLASHLKIKTTTTTTTTTSPCPYIIIKKLATSKVL